MSDEINSATEKEARKNLQRYLRRLSYFEPSIPPPPIDGVAGEETTRAIRAFQILYGLDANGVADRVTFNQLFEAYEATVEKYSPPLCISPFPDTPDDYRLERGDRSPIVKLVQFMLMEISAIYDGISLTLSGVYDTETEAAVSELQTVNLLPINGNVDKTTWDALARAYGYYLFYTDP